MQFPKVKAKKLLHHGFFSLQEDLLEKEEGQSHPYTSLHCKTDAVAILAQDQKGRWILNREYRHATGKILLGCPGGRLDEGEDPIVGGKRELLEETGFALTKATQIGACYPFPGVCSQTIHYIFGTHAEKIAEPCLDPLECIEPLLLTDHELREEIRKGIPVDGILLTALWYTQAT